MDASINHFPQPILETSGWMPKEQMAGLTPHRLQSSHC